MTLHFMSDKELSRVEILRDLGSGRLTDRLDEAFTWRAERTLSQ